MELPFLESAKWADTSRRPPKGNSPAKSKPRVPTHECDCRNCSGFFYRNKRTYKCKHECHGFCEGGKSCFAESHEFTSNWHDAKCVWCGKTEKPKSYNFPVVDYSKPPPF